MTANPMREFWDDRAREDAFHFTDPREPYAHADEERFWSGGERELDALLQDLGVVPARDDRVLELGCGLGRLTRPLAGRVAHVTAVDVSPEMLSRAQELNGRLDNVEWVLGDGETLAGIEAASHDGAVARGVLAHIPAAKVQLGYVAELARVVRPGGWLVFDLSTDPRVHEQRETPSRRGFFKAMVGRTPSGKDEPAWRGAAVPLDALGAMAAHAGLELERIDGAGTRSTVVRATRSRGA